MKSVKISEKYTENKDKKCLILCAEILTMSKQDLIQHRQELSNLIEDVEDDEIQTIMLERFIRLKSRSEIGQVLYYDRSTIYKKLKRYLERKER